MQGKALSVNNDQFVHLPKKSEHTVDM